MKSYSLFRETLYKKFWKLLLNKTWTFHKCTYSYTNAYFYVNKWNSCICWCDKSKSVVLIVTRLRSHNPNTLKRGVLLETDVFGKECTCNINAREGTKNGLQYTDRIIKHFFLSHPKLITFHAGSLVEMQLFWCLCAVPTGDKHNIRKCHI